MSWQSRRPLAYMSKFISFVFSSEFINFFHPYSIILFFHPYFSPIFYYFVFYYYLANCLSLFFISDLCFN